jgi:hypothetical protein
MFPPPGNPIISNNPIIQGFMKLDCLTCNRIRQQDVYTQTWTKFISRNYDPDSTLILVQGSQYDWRRVSYQLPAFRTLQILTSIDEMPRAQLSYHNNITYGQKELVIPRQLTTILCLTEDSLFLETSILPTSIFHKQNIDLDICWYESLLPPKMMIEGLSIIKL